MSNCYDTNNRANFVSPQQTFMSISIRFTDVDKCVDKSKLAPRPDTKYKHYIYVLNRNA